MNEKVTIALHSGKIEYYPLIENFIKSMLLCVTYPEIEIMLIESDGNTKIRKWFNEIDFNDYFVNFSGKKTSIKKNPNIKIEKNIQFYDYPSNYEWFECFTESIQKAINNSTGKYFCFFAEDNQFNVSGDIISDYIEILKNENNYNSFVHFFAQQKYKFFKKNNYFNKKYSIINDVKYFKPEHKWDFWSITLTENYKKIGNLKKSTLENPHKTIQEYSQRTKNMNYIRVYPMLPHGVWFHNNDREKIIKRMLENENNPDYVYYKIFKKEEIEKMIEDYNMPIATDDYLREIN